MPRRYHKRGGDLVLRSSSYDALSRGPMRVRQLPGHDSFTFTMYGCPGPLEDLQALVETMKRESLGNGFDPGPGVGPANQKQYDYLRKLGWPVVGYASTADHQVKEGTCRLSDEQNAILKNLDNAGIFAATQLGEWGYYFHNLSHQESWWRAVYRDEFNQWKHLMKPQGLAGYDARPGSKRECYGIVEDYFRTRQRHMRGWNLSITGHSHYEAYAGQWGAKVIGLELGENIAFTQSKMAFARGAARRNAKPWSIQVSQWFAGSATSSGPLQVNEGGVARGLDAGHSLSFYERMWLHAWFAGTAMVTPEASIGIFFETAQPPYKLTPYGRKAGEVFKFVQGKQEQRGIPLIPLAVVLDQFSGYNAYMGKPWGILEPTPGDLQVRDLFQEQLFPGSDHIHRKPFPENPEASYLRPTPFGEIVDVQLSDAPSEVLAAYPAILLAGDHSMTPEFVEKLKGLAEGGTRLLISQAHAARMGKADLSKLKAKDRVEVLEPWIHPKTKRPTAISNARLRDFVGDYLPVEVGGSPVLYQINRSKTGWVVEIVNNSGVVKFPTKPAVIDRTATARVSIRIKVPCKEAREWRSGIKLPIVNGRVQLEIGPGETAFVEIR